MKGNRNKIIKKSKKKVFLLLANMDEFTIPMSYIKRIKRNNGHISELIIKKDYLKILSNKYHMFYSYENSLESSVLKFRTALNVTNIVIGKKWYKVNYIEPSSFGWGENNILQSISETENVIIFSWNTYLKNKVLIANSGNWYDNELQIEEKYKHIPFDYKKVKFIPNFIKL